MTTVRFDNVVTVRPWAIPLLAIPICSPVFGVLLTVFVGYRHFYTDLSSMLLSAALVVGLFLGVLWLLRKSRC